MASRDEFEYPSTRQRAFPTLQTYCASRTDEQLAAIIWDATYQRNVFSTYPGTVGEHALTIVAAIKQSAAYAPSEDVAGVVERLRGPLSITVEDGARIANLIATLSTKVAEEGRRAEEQWAGWVKADCAHRAAEARADRLERGLQIIASTFYKEDQYQDYAKHVLAALTETEGDHTCPICAKPFKPNDLCATDITEGTCHAACLEGSPVVNLHTGEQSDGPVDTYTYDEDATVQEGGR